MRGYPVYRIRPEDHAFVRIGSVIELRRSRRSMNRVGLTRLARKLFAMGPNDLIFIGLDSILERHGGQEELASVLSAG